MHDAVRAIAYRHGRHHLLPLGIDDRDAVIADVCHEHESSVRRYPYAMRAKAGLHRLRHFSACLILNPAPEGIQEPLHATPFMACSGDGWIVPGLVVTDRLRV